MPERASDRQSQPGHPPAAVTVVVPTFNEGPNVAALVDRLTTAMSGVAMEILFVDDSTDDTPAEIRRVAAVAEVPVRLLHRDDALGGLGGAVVEGLREASAPAAVVMDGDLQHPPEDVPRLWARLALGDVDLVVASRYTGEGSAGGLGNAVRTSVSNVSTTLTKAMFPVRLKGVTDPMTGFFAVDLAALDLDALRPRGFKVLLEILARTPLRTAEVPFSFARRHAGSSKASFREGMTFLRQLGDLRFGKMSGFAIIGALGAVLNVAIVWALTHLGVGYVWAAIIGAELTIIGNFVLFEKVLFRDMRDQARPLWARFLESFAFNNAEALVRIPLVALLVETGHISAALATAITLVVAFFARFLFHSLVVYAPRRRRSASAERTLAKVDAQVTAPGEL